MSNQFRAVCAALNLTFPLDEPTCVHMDRRGKHVRFRHPQGEPEICEQLEDDIWSGRAGCSECDWEGAEALEHLDLARRIR